MPFPNTESKKKTIHPTDSAGIEAVLRTTDQVEFFLFEEVSGYTMQVVTRSASPGGRSHFLIELARGRGIRTWKHAETAFAFIKKICPPNIAPRNVTVIFKKPQHVAEAEQELTL